MYTSVNSTSNSALNLGISTITLVLNMRLVKSGNETFFNFSSKSAKPVRELVLFSTQVFMVLAASSLLAKLTDSTAEKNCLLSNSLNFSCTS
ncbi:hypothetical protein CVS40_10115 [Lucilia cuprina]|nr:hypothetical protein CVS40_10115 [Lucilia cuprina]